MYTPTFSPKPPTPADNTNPVKSWKSRITNERSSKIDLNLEVFQHKTRDFHGIEHDALNAELRYKIEVPLKEWDEAIKEVNGFLSRTCPKGEVVNDKILSGFMNYIDGYHCGEDLYVTPHQIVAKEALRLTPERVEDLQMWSTRILSVNEVENTFTELESASHLYPVEFLESRKKMLQPIDELSRHPISDCSIALHERKHFNTTDALKEELKCGASYLEALDKRILDTFNLRKHAVEEVRMQQAMECLQEEVTIGSDLVSININRYNLFSDAENDAAEHRKDVSALIDAAKLMTHAFKDLVEASKGGIQEDMSDVRGALKRVSEKQEKHMKDVIAQNEFDTNKIDELTKKETTIWKELMAKIAELEGVVEEKNIYVLNSMNRVEQSSKTAVADSEYFRALTTHNNALRECQEVIDNLTGIVDSFERYVLAMSPQLMEVCDDADDCINELKIAETILLLGRYDRFAEASEEACERTLNRIDAIERQQRQRMLDMEVAKNTLDPCNPDEYMMEVDKGVSQASSLSEYYNNVKVLGIERKKDTAAVIDFALDILAGEPEGDPLIVSADVNVISTGVVPKRKERQKIEEYERRQMDPATNNEDTGECVSNSLMRPRTIKKVDLTRHPQLAAALRTLDEDSFNIDKAITYVQREQEAVDAKLSSIRLMSQMSKQGKMPTTESC
eukprot:Tbor_TRINITY_DN5303_c5_g1::TRINITY_DN5303_c5_g1_i1::g.4007::m.4007